jgi:hypothetical protein
VRRALKLSGLAVVFAGGVLLAGTVVGGQAADTTGADITITETTTAETTTTAEVTTTEESTTTAEATTTVERTTTRVVRVPTSGTTTETSSSDNATPDWVWVLLGILAVGLVVLIVLLARRGGGGGVSDDERRRQLDTVVGSWAAQGWAIESQTTDSAVLRRGDESMLVSVDSSGRVSTRPLGST